MGEVSWWTVPVPSLVILVSVVLVLMCRQTHRQNHRCGWLPYSCDSKLVIADEYSQLCFGLNMFCIVTFETVFIHCFCHSTNSCLYLCLCLHARQHFKCLLQTVHCLRKLCFSGLNVFIDVWLRQESDRKIYNFLFPQVV